TLECVDQMELREIKCTDLAGRQCRILKVTSWTGVTFLQGLLSVKILKRKGQGQENSQYQESDP
ncbi:hypothetical protein ACFLT9_14375, partial [Acidobacteriota bacterium]